jgi:hypothetical protein
MYAINEVFDARAVEKDRQVSRRSRSVFPLAGHARSPLLHRYPAWSAPVVVLIATAFCAGIVLAPATFADSTANVRNAVASLRGETSCAPLRYDPVVEQAAGVINRLNDEYVSHAARQEPVDDPLPGLKDLGYSGRKAKILQGAAKNDGDAIKAMLLEGYDAIPDCSYADFGVNLRRNDSTGFTFATMVLAGT